VHPLSGAELELAARLIDTTVAVASVDGIRVALEVALHPFEVHEARTIGELVQHARRHEWRFRIERHRGRQRHGVLLR
jgi:hypothetical protein